MLDDRSLIWYMDQEDGYTTTDAGRRGDDGVSPYRSNHTNDKSAPLYMELSPENFLDALVLTQDEIDTGEVISTDPDNPDYVGQTAVARAWSRYETLEALVPDNILTTPTASRGDILHAATWQDGTWIHEFKRKLSTGNDDDVEFSYNTSMNSVSPFSTIAGGEKFHPHITLTEMVNIKYFASGNVNGS